MAVTQDEERAAKLSDDFKRDIQEKIAKVKAGDYINFTTPSLWKKKDDINVPLWWLVNVVDKEPDIRIDIYRDKKKQSTILTGTKTKAAIDRLFDDLCRRATKELRNAWVEDIRDTGKTSKESLKKPMLLHKWEKQKAKIIYPCYVQPKHDGIRAMYDSKTGKLYSRSGKVISMPHVTVPLNEFGAGSLDGELAFEDWTVPLQEVTHAISEQNEQLRFHVFDNIEDHDKPFEERFVQRVKGWFDEGGLARACPSVLITSTQLMHNEQEVDNYYEEATQAGMEGVVVRNALSPYQFGRRTMHTLKYKLEYEEVFAIEGYQVIPHPDGDLMQFISTFNGKQFEVVPAWKHDERREMLRYLESVGLEPDIRHQKIGDMLIEYRGVTLEGKPYHAVGKTKFQALMEDIKACVE